jgi:hypothetical protein
MTMLMCENSNSFKLQTLIEEKPLGERDPRHHENRFEEEQKINGGGERFRGEEERAFGRRENVSEKMRKNRCLVTGIVEIGITNWE